MDVQRSKIVSYLASYAGMKPTADFGALDLHGDLRLEPLDLVLFALELEQNADSPFPFEALDHVKTVSDLLLVVTKWLADEARAEIDDRGTSAAYSRSSKAQGPSTSSGRSNHHN